MLTGRCHCGAVQFQVSADPVSVSICHCSDCRGQSGAPLLAWAMVPRAALNVRGEPQSYASSETGARTFCGTCGTGLFFTNIVLDDMKMVQIRVASLDDPGAIAPRFQVQRAERIAWTDTIGQLPGFERFPV